MSYIYMFKFYSVKRLIVLGIYKHKIYILENVLCLGNTVHRRSHPGSQGEDRMEIKVNVIGKRLTKGICIYIKYEHRP